MLSKLLLSEIRSGDFAHAGDIEAIDLVISKIYKNQDKLLLDVGCGLGGTAKYLKDNGFINTIGIDINQDVINHAKANYPDIEFYNCDILNITKHFKPIFDIVVLFNSFYAFTSQENSLLAMSQISNYDAQLVIFDYFTPSVYKEKNPFYTDGRPFTPINKNNIDKMLNVTKWQLNEFVCLTNKYKEWYLQIINLLDQKKSELISKFDTKTFNFVYSSFSNLIDLMADNKLGGCIIVASKVLK
jgi:SAM-dependent methyltransferase